MMNYVTPSPSRDSPDYEKFNQDVSMIMMIPQQHRRPSSPNMHVNPLLSPYYSTFNNLSNNNEVHQRHSVPQNQQQNVCYSNHDHYNVVNRNNTEPTRHHSGGSSGSSSHAHGFRRHRDINYDEEQRKYRRSESLDRKQVIRSTTFDKNSDFNKRVSSSFDSLDSPPPTRKDPPLLTCGSNMSSVSHSDMIGLTRRVQGMRMVSITPETSV